MEDYSTEYLIMHEDEIDWDKLSKNPNRIFSLAEARLFRRKINWLQYLIIHSNSITPNILEVASKYFTPEVYKYLTYAGIANEEFVLNHRENFDILQYIISNLPSEDFLLAVLDCWKDDEFVKKTLAKRLDLSKAEYKNIRLLYEIE